MLDALVRVIVGDVQPVGSSSAGARAPFTASAAPQSFQHSQQPLGSAARSDQLASMSLSLALKPKLPRAVDSQQQLLEPQSLGGVPNAGKGARGGVSNGLPRQQAAFVARGQHNGLMELDAKQLLLLLDALNQLGFNVDEPGALLELFVARAKTY